METVEEIIPHISPYVGASGVCDDPSLVLARINDVRRLLWDKGDWNNTLEWVCICCAGDCLVLPAKYKQIRAAYINDSPASLKNEWYETVYGIGKNQCNGIENSLIEVGRTPVFRDYTGGPFQLRIYCELADDEGVEVAISSRGQGGVITKEVFALSQTPQESVKSYEAVISVVKPETKGRVRLYAVNKNTGEYILIALYLPTDKNPSFRKFKVKALKCPSLTILAKKQYFDLKAGSDLVEFDINAMIFASMAINYREARDLNQFMANLTLAVAELNKEISDEEIPTASPLRIGWTQQVSNLIS
jgi:hypothetical protein